MMRKVVVTATGAEVQRVDEPTPGPGEVLVRTSVSGICGSDTHALHGRHPNITLPYAPGHEVVGVVAAAGRDVTALVPGARVTVQPYLPDWTCKQCLAGRPNLCENLDFFGCGTPQGGMADSFTIDARRLFPVPDDLDDKAAALIEPLATPVHAFGLAGPVEGKAVAILGAGTIGLLAVRVAKARGARRVVVTARSERSRARALSAGADATVNAADPHAPHLVRDELGESADVVLDCVAEESTLVQALSIADKGGTIVVVGVPTSDVKIPLALLQDSQIRIQGSATYLTDDYTEAVTLLRTGAVDPSTIVTAIHPLDKAPEAFTDASTGSHIKVLLDPRL
jgi:L-iditol 2-dehydrogenase